MRRGAAILVPVVVLALGAAAARGQDASPREPLVVRGSSGPLAVTATVTPGAPRIGEAFLLRLEARVDEGASANRVRWPDVAGEIASALGDEVVEAGPARRSEDGRTLEVPLRLFDAGSFDLPPFTIALAADGASETPPWEVRLDGPLLEVASVLPADAEPLPPRDALPWAPETDREFPWALGALAAAAAAAAVAVLILARRRRDPIAAAPPLPPHARALLALDALEARRLPEAGRVEPYFVQLSEILRRYLEERFGLRAPEQTTEEFLAAAAGTEAGRRAIDAARRETLRGFLEQADLVKFARAAPDPAACRSAGATARRFVEETAPGPDPADVAALVEPER